MEWLSCQGQSGDRSLERETILATETINAKRKEYQMHQSQLENDRKKVMEKKKEKRIESERVSNQLQCENDNVHDTQFQSDKLHEKMIDSETTLSHEHQRLKHQKKSTRKAQNKALLKKLQIEGMKQLQELEEYIDSNQ